MKVNIDRDVPLPPPRNQRRYPYPQLAVGESFFVADVTQNAIANQAYRWSRKLGRRFETRKRPGGVRVWRTE